MTAKIYVSEKELLEMCKKGFNIKNPWQDILDILLVYIRQRI